MKVSNDDTFTGKFNLGGITLVDFSRKVPVKRMVVIDGHGGGLGGSTPLKKFIDPSLNAQKTTKNPPKIRAVGPNFFPSSRILEL